jgi:hypothetical protein
MARFINFMNSLVPNGIVHLLFLFSHFKKTNSNITGRTVSALLTEELLEKIMLAKTKHKKLWKFY